MRKLGGVFLVGVAIFLSFPQSSGAKLMPTGGPGCRPITDLEVYGFILSNAEIQLIFCKTNERYIPLTMPKNIVKEINPEEC